MTDGSDGKVKIVEALPVLDQGKMGDFPDFDSDGHVLMSYGTAWGKSQMETAGCAVITACKIAGEWKPLGVRDYFDILERYQTFRIMRQAIIDGVWMLVEVGDIEIIEFEGRQYLVPTPNMVRIALAGSLRII